MIFFFFFKQKPADEVRISDWSSDVCSSDLLVEVHPDREARQVGVRSRRTKGPPDRDTERLGLTPVQRGEDGLAVVEVLVRERLRDAGLCREALHAHRGDPPADDHSGRGIEQLLATVVTSHAPPRRRPRAGGRDGGQRRSRAREVSSEESWRAPTATPGSSKGRPQRPEGGSGRGAGGGRGGRGGGRPGG